MALSERQSLGRVAEQRASDYLQARGLVPLASNVSCKAGEIDLVLRDGDELVFVEVRSRRGSAFGGAAASVGPVKQAKVRRAAQLYLLRTYGQRAWPACRFDVVAFEGDTCRWIQAAF